MIEILPKLQLYKLSRAIGWPRLMPISYTISVSYNCNSRCKTCNVWKKKANDLTLEEWDQVFTSIGKGPVWFTFSGGEPFLRPDIEKLVKLAYNRCQPQIINIPTNGILWNIIPRKAEEIAKSCPESEVVINLSLDQVGAKHEEIRQIPGNWGFSMKTWEGLKDVQKRCPNLTLGIHSVVSNFNVDDFKNVYDGLNKLKPDSYITEIAEERVELDTIGTGITPSYDKYSKAIDYVMEQMKKRSPKGVARMAWAFRLQYYQIVKKWVRDKKSLGDRLPQGKQIIPCYAGQLSVQISPDGDLWACCIRASKDAFGNLRKANYDFRKVWFSTKADKIRQSIKNKECSCPLANAHYTNMLEHFPTLFKAGWKVLFK
ncbi:MAG: hypothetical protein ACD_58C00146G0005 [uncultured bacterium]|nr:MAG: hypothetical protein ACD_58C00146G0005 [uncultured bacterium]